MAMDETSAARKRSMQKWQQAQQFMDKGKTEKALELVREALREDPSYAEMRLWVAKHYVDAGETRKAAAHLERVLQADHDHDEAWELLEQTDPNTAERLRRLHDVAPDPFVAKRTASETEDVGDIDEFIDEEAEESGFLGGESYAGRGASGISADFMPSVAEGGRPGVGLAEQQQEEREYGTEQPWEYEQDREFLAKWQAQPLVAEAVARIQELWEDLEVWERVYVLCAHGSRQLHEEIFEPMAAATERMGVEMPDLYVFPERCMHPVLIKLDEPVLAVPRAITRAMTPAEMMFQIGREIGHLNTGYLAEMQMVKVICDRPTRLAGDMASALREFLADQVGYRGYEHDDEEVERLQKIGHAWQQRCELTADRAGLICCGDIDVACRTLAKTTAQSQEEAQELTEEAFLEQFEGEDVGQLARVPVEDSPSRSPRYVAYRIHMLRWWANTKQAAEYVS